MPISLSGSLNLSGSLTTTGTITATTLVVQTITSSISSITGSTNFGSLVTDTHKFTGSINASGSATFSGSVNIGTAGSEKLNIFGAGSQFINVKNTTTNADMFVGMSSALSASFIGTGGTDPIVFSTAGTEKMRITSAGIVAIGGTAASRKLQVNTSGNDGIRILTSGDNPVLDLMQTAAVNVNARNWRIVTNWEGWGTLDFQSGTTNTQDPATTRLTISGVNGNVGIGGGDSIVRLNIVGAGATGSTYSLYITNSTPTPLFFVRNDGYMFFGLDTNSPYNIAQSGRTCILASNGRVGYLVSTRESKANIESIKNVDFINQLNPVQFNYRKKDDITNTFTDELEENITYGFIADEVEKVNKELVFYNSDNTTLAGVDYNSIIAILTKAIQELTARVQYLENK
jgi:hypothetical protein